MLFSFQPIYKAKSLIAPFKWVFLASSISSVNTPKPDLVRLDTRSYVKHYLFFSTA